MPRPEPPLQARNRGSLHSTGSSSSPLPPPINRTAHTRAILIVHKESIVSLRWHTFLWVPAPTTSRPRQRVAKPVALRGQTKPPLLSLHASCCTRPGGVGKTFVFTLASTIIRSPPLDPSWFCASHRPCASVAIWRVAGAVLHSLHRWRSRIRAVSRSSRPLVSPISPESSLVNQPWADT